MQQQLESLAVTLLHFLHQAMMRLSTPFTELFRFEVSNVGRLDNYNSFTRKILANRVHVSGIVSVSVYKR